MGLRAGRLASFLVACFVCVGCESRATEVVHRALERTLSAPSWQAIVDTPEGSVTFEVQQTPVPRIHVVGGTDGGTSETFVDDRVYVATDPTAGGTFVGFTRPCAGRAVATRRLIEDLMGMDLVAAAKPYTASSTGYDAVVPGAQGRIHVEIADGLVTSVRFYGVPTTARGVVFRSVGTLDAIIIPPDELISYPAIGSPTVPEELRDTIGFLRLLADCAR